MVSNIELANRLVCPMMDAKKTLNEASLYLYKTIEWAFICEFDGNIPDKKALDKKFESLWISYCKEKDTINSKEYWAGFRYVRKSILAVYDLFKFYTVIKPIQSFSLITNGVEITGKYGIIERRSTRGLPFVFILRDSKTEVKEIPDIIDVTSWYSANLEYPKVGIWNFSFTGDTWKYKGLVEDVAYTLIEGVINRIKSSYYVPGPHCSQCISHKCKEILDL